MRHNATAAEAARIDGGATLLIVPMESQPPDGYTLLGKDELDKSGRWFRWYKPPTSNFRAECPFRPGERLEIAEPHCHFYDDDDVVAHDEYQYRAGHDDEHDDEIDWRPASEMPDWAIRWRPLIVAATARRLGELHWLDWSACGFGPAPGRHNVSSPNTDKDWLACRIKFRESWSAERGGFDPGQHVWLVTLKWSE